MTDEETKEVPQEADEPQEQELSEIEQIAIEMGWKPVEDFSGNEDDYVDAATYIRRGGDIQETMRKSLKDQKRKLSDLTRAMEALRVHNDKVYKVQVASLEKQISELKKQKKNAIEEGDVDLVEQLDEQIDDLRIASVKEDKQPQQPQSNPVWDAWHENNEWYGSDEDMTSYADTLADTPEIRGLPLKRKLEVVTNAVKKYYPDAFPKAPAKRKSIPSVESPRLTNTRKKTYSRADMTKEQQVAMDRFLAILPEGLKSEQEYINDLVAVGEVR